jgi:hypothetical protein
MLNQHGIDLAWNGSDAYFDRTGSMSSTDPELCSSEVRRAIFLAITPNQRAAPK